jgi:hypothetical protein
MSAEIECNNCVNHRQGDMTTLCRVCLTETFAHDAKYPFFKLKEVRVNTPRNDDDLVKADQQRRAFTTMEQEPLKKYAEAKNGDVIPCTKADLTGGVRVMALVLPTDSAERKEIPMCSGVFDYFPAALAEIAKISKAGNDQHNPGEPLHWARGKSMDNADCIARHLMDRGTVDPVDGKRHTAKLAWRALAMLQLELEAAGAPQARGAW